MVSQILPGPGRMNNRRRPHFRQDAVLWQDDLFTVTHGHGTKCAPSFQTQCVNPCIAPVRELLSICSISKTDWGLLLDLRVLVRSLRMHAATSDMVLLIPSDNPLLIPAILRGILDEDRVRIMTVPPIQPSPSSSSSSPRMRNNFSTKSWSFFLGQSSQLRARTVKRWPCPIVAGLFSGTSTVEHIVVVVVVVVAHIRRMPCGHTHGP